MAICGHRTKNCVVKSGGCGYRYAKEDYELWACPKCGKDRHCKTHANVCRMHGRKTPTGIAANNFQNKGYSKYLPKNLLALYDEVSNSQEKLTFNAKIDLLETHLREMIEQLHSKSSPDHLLEIHKLWKNWRKIDRQTFETEVDKLKAMDTALEPLEKAILKGASNTKSWDAITTYVERIVRVAEAENRRIEASRGKMDVTDVLFLVRAAADAVREEVEDDDLLRRIQERFADILGAHGIKVLPDTQS